MNQLKLPRQGGLITWLLLLVLLVLLGVAGIGQTSADEKKSKSPKRAEAAAKDQSDKSGKSEAGHEVKKADKKKKPAKPPAKVVALIGGKIHTMASAGVIDVGTVVITGDLITAVGKDVKIPDGAEKIDVTGMVVSPGFIDSRSSLWLAADSVSASASDGSLNAIDAVDPYSDSWIEVARQGVTAVSIQPSGALGGQSAVLRVAPSSSIKALVIKESAAVQASLGLSGSTGNSRDRYLQYESLKKKLTAAKTYKEEWEKYAAAISKASGKDSDKANSKTAKDQPAESSTGTADPKRQGISAGRGRPVRGGPPKEAAKTDKAETAKPASSSTTESKDKDEKKTEPPKEPKRDANKDLLVRVLKKEVPLRIEAHRADDVANALKLAEDFDLTFIMEGLSQAGRTWSVLEKKHPPLVVGPFVQFETTPSYASDDADRYEQLSDVAGLKAIGSYSKNTRGSRLIRHHAAAAVAAGMSPDSALRAITIDAAKVLGVDAMTGSLEVGKKADIAVVAGNPLNPAAASMLTISHGDFVYRAVDTLQPVPPPALADVVALKTDLPDEFSLVSDRVIYPDGTIAAGAVLVKSGLISAVSTHKTETGGVPVIDVGSAVISPGLIVGHFAEVDVASTAAVQSQVRAIDSFSPASTRLTDLSNGGFTSVMYSPGSRSVVCGQIGCVRLHASDPVLMDKAQPVLPASKFVLSSSARSTSRFPASLSGQLTLANNFFNGKNVDSNLYIPAAVRKLMTAEHNRLLRSLKEKSTVAVIEAGSSPEVQAAVSLIRTHGLKALILHPEDLQASVDAVKSVDAGLIVRSAKITDHDWYAKDIADASNKGVKVSVSGDNPDKLRQTMALLVNAGMSPEAAVRSLTSDAAAGFGLTKIGMLKAGAVADIVIWDGSPINLMARPIHVIVDGRLTKDMQ